MYRHNKNQPQSINLILSAVPEERIKIPSSFFSNGVAVDPPAVSGIVITIVVIDHYACGFEPEGGIARCRNDDPHELREVAVRRRRLRRERFDLPGEGLLAEACRPAEKLARPAVEHGQMRRQVERPAAEYVNGLV